MATAPDDDQAVTRLDLSHPDWTCPGVIRRVPGGPALVHGPAHLTLPDGREAVSDRCVVAVCRCGRSAIHPWCDTSHRELSARDHPRAD